MKIHKTKEEAIGAIEKFASIVKAASVETGADFLAEASDDTGMEYYIDAVYRNEEGTIQGVQLSFQTLGL